MSSETVTVVETPWNVTVTDTEFTVTTGTTEVAVISVGTQGPAGSSSVFTSEIPSGTIDGVNDTFTLSVAPVRLLVFVNGLLQQNGSLYDYVATLTTITFNADAIPQTGDSLIALISS